MVILWTDALIFLLLAISLALGFYLHDKEHIRRPLKKLANNKTGMVSLTILVFFLVIGLLDSIHYKSGQSTSNEVISLLDSFTASIRRQSEKTYSAPFAATLFSKEMIADNDGRTEWAYPRLVYGGRHLKNPDKDRVNDILIKTLIGGTQGLILAALFIGVAAGAYYLKFGLITRKFFTHPVAITGFCLILVSYTLGYLSNYYHVLGTDKVGEDVFYQAIKSVRTGLVIGTLTTLIMLPMAILFGIMAGYFQGWVDDLIQYLYTTLNSIPGVLLIAASILMVQVYMANHEDQFTSVLARADMRLLFLCMILGVTSWTGLCRLLRAETLKLREMEYVQAAKALGVKQATILARHILPNLMHIVLISVVLDFSSLVLAEAVLSYINIGVDPTTYSWGNMINGARLEMAREPVVWWSLTAAFVFMFALVLAANLFADSVQAAFDPRSAGHESAA
jgi:peptide/nickel transport system permease protein